MPAVGLIALLLLILLNGLCVKNAVWIMSTSMIGGDVVTSVFIAIDNVPVTTMMISVSLYTVQTTLHHDCVYAILRHANAR